MADVPCFPGFGDASLTDPRVSILRWQPDKKFWGVTQRGWYSKSVHSLAPVLKSCPSKREAECAQMSVGALGCLRGLEELQWLMK